MSKNFYLSKDDYSIETISDATGVTVTLVVYNAGTYEGKAFYKPGDTFNRKFAEDLARNKAWRAYWTKRAKDSMKNSRCYEAIMNQLIDEGCAAAKKAAEINAYIEQMVQS